MEKVRISYLAICFLFIAACCKSKISGTYISNDSDYECNIIYLSETGNYYQLIVLDSIKYSNSGQYTLLKGHDYYFKGVKYFDKSSKKITELPEMSTIIDGSNIIFDFDNPEKNFKK